MNIFKQIQAFFLNLYCSKDRTQRYIFWFKNCGSNGWRAYIMSPINYRRRDTSLHATHRFYDAKLRLHYVCWTKPLYSKRACEQVADLWSDRTTRYIKKGIRF